MLIKKVLMLMKVLRVQLQIVALLQVQMLQMKVMSQKKRIMKERVELQGRRMRVEMLKRTTVERVMKTMQRPQKEVMHL